MRKGTIFAAVLLFCVVGTAFADTFNFSFSGNPTTYSSTGFSQTGLLTLNGTSSSQSIGVAFDSSGNGSFGSESLGSLALVGTPTTTENYSHTDQVYLYSYSYMCGFFSTCWVNVYGNQTYYGSTYSASPTFTLGDMFTFNGDDYVITDIGSSTFTWSKSGSYGDLGTFLYSNVDSGSGTFEAALIQPVPEPASLLLLGTGLIAASRSVRRKLHR